MARIGLVIPAQGDFHTVEIKREGNLDLFKKIVGGWIEGVYPAPGLTLYCNEEGKLMGLPINERATVIVQDLFLSSGFVFDDVLCGDVVLIGNDGSEYDAGLDSEWITQFKSIGLWPEEEA